MLEEQEGTLNQHIVLALIRQPFSSVFLLQQISEHSHVLSAK
jgi:hypothetical protein